MPLFFFFAGAFFTAVAAFFGAAAAARWDLGLGGINAAGASTAQIRGEFAQLHYQRGAGGEKE